jgi:hypothetical protein
MKEVVDCARRGRHDGRVEGVEMDEVSWSALLEKAAG